MIASVKMNLLFLVLLVAHDMQGCLGAPRCTNRIARIRRPLCGSDGKTYRNKWHLRNHNCWTGEQVTVIYNGHCMPGVDQNPNGCTNRIPRFGRPVCGSDGKTYRNKRALRNHNCWTGEQVTVKYYGPCRPEDSSPGGRPWYQMIKDLYDAGFYTKNAW